MGNKQSTTTTANSSAIAGSKPADTTFDLYSFPFENIVFEGGSNNLLAFVGAVRCLEEAGIWSRIVRLAGSGTGALLATLLCIGYNSLQLDGMLDFNIRTLTQDRSCAGCCLGCSMRSSFGWHPNDKVITWLGARIKEAAGAERATFMQIYKKFNRELCVVVTNLSESSAEYFHHKTTPDMAVIDAIHMTLATPGLCSPVKHRLGTSDQLFADGGIFHNYPIHSFDGWWLSTHPDDSFLCRHGLLHDQTRLTDDRTRFAKFNSKTLGFIVYDDFTSSSLSSQLDERCSQQKTAAVVVPNNTQAKNWDKRKQEAESALAIYMTYTDKANKFIAATNDVISDMKKPLTKTDIDDLLKRIQSVSDADLKTLFGSRHSADDIWLLVKPALATQPCANDIVGYLENASFNFYRRCRQRCTSNDVSGLTEYWVCLEQSIHAANGRRFVQSKDVERTVGINVRYIGALHNNQLSKQDRVFLIEQGRQAARAYLEQFVHVSWPPIKDAPDRRSYCRDDLAHFIDDEVSEIIDERDYMEAAVTNKHR